MDRKQVLSRFIKQNLKVLSSPKATKKVVKKLRQTYFEKYHLSAAVRFTNNEVAHEVVTQISKAKKDQDTEDITMIIKNIPFIVAELDNDEIDAIITIYQLEKSPQLTTDDLSRLREERYLTTVEDEFRSRAVRKAEEQLEESRIELETLREQLAEEIRSLEDYKSELDSIPPDADFEMLIESVQEPTKDRELILWWKELGLEMDPFRSNRGLTGFPVNKYDDVVVITPFIKSYIESVEQFPDELLDKTIVVSGEFGSGKTTLFQIIAHRSGRSGIFPILTVVNPDPSVSKLNRQLVSQIITILSETFRYKPDSNIPGYPGVVDEYGICIQIMSAAASVSATSGFLICVDGLHKSEGYLHQSLEFMQQLQNIQDRMSNSGITCGILIAGSNDWETEILSNPSLSGSFYRIDKIPALSEESAVEAVVRRIQSCVPATKPAPTIMREPLRHAFQVLTGRLHRPPTFRDFLDHVRDKFTSRDYAGVGLSLSLHTETIELVQNYMMQSNLGDRYSNLIDPSQHSLNFRLAVKTILPDIFINHGITETNPLFKYNKGAFYLLKQSGFITARRADEKRTMIWHLSKYIVEILEDIRERHRIPPVDALEAMFSDPIKSLPRETETIYSYVKKQMMDMAASWRSSWKEISILLDNTIVIISKIESASETPDKLVSHETTEYVKVSLKNLMKAIMIATGEKSVNRDFDPTKFSQLWCAPERSETIDILLHDSQRIPKDSSGQLGLIQQHAQALGDMCSILSDLIRGEGVSRITGRILTAGEASQIHEARILFLSQQYKETVELLCDIVEKKIRDTVYLALKCIRGQQYLKMIPDDIRKRFKGPVKGHPRTKRPYDENILYDVSRSEYNKIIFKKDVANLIFKGIISDVELSSLRDSFELLFSLGDREAHGDRPSYFRKHSTEIADVLKTTPRICELFNRVIDGILSGDDFSIVQSGVNLHYSFGRKELGYKQFSLDILNAEAISYELLERLDGNPITLPPIDSWLNTISGNPEDVIASLRACIEYETIHLEKGNEPFEYSINITQRGKEKLYSKSSSIQTQLP